MKQKRKGFTLAELLIVVAVIAVLVAIAIPIFTSQLERSRESTDLANARGMYAEIMASAIGNDTAFLKADGTYEGVYSPLKQKEDGWQTTKENLVIGGVPSSEWIGEPGPDGSCTITYNPDTGSVTISWNGSGGGGGSGDDSGGDSGSTPEEAQKDNTKLANDIGNAVLKMMQDAGEGNGVHIYITIGKGGTISISFGGQSAGLTADKIMTGLEKAGLVSGGKVNFDPADTAQSYEISVHKNGGNGGTVTVTRH